MKKLQRFIIFAFLFSFLSVSAEDYFWFGGQGLWSDLNSWRTSVGLIPLTPPDEEDNVIFNANSFTTEYDTVFINANNPVCKNLVFTNLSFPVVLAGGTGNSSFKIFGSVTLHPMVINNYYGAIRFESNQPGNTVTCAGSKFSGSVYFEGSGEYIIQDTLFVYDSTDWMSVIFDDSTTSFTPPIIFHTNGTLNTNSQTVISRGFRTDGSFPRVLIVDNSDFYIDGNWYCKNTPLDLSSENLDIIIRGKIENLNGETIFINDITFLPQLGIPNAGFKGNIIENTGVRTDVRKIHFLSSGKIDGLKQFNNPGFFTIDTVIWEGGFDLETGALIPCEFRANESDVHYSQVKVAPGIFLQNQSYFHRADFDGAYGEFTSKINNSIDSLMFNNPFAYGRLGGVNTINNLLFYAYEGTIAAGKEKFNTVNRLVFSNDGNFLGNNFIDSLQLTTGHWYRMHADSLIHPGSIHTNAFIQTIDYIEVGGECGDGVCIISSDNIGTQAIMNYTGGTYPSEYLQIRDIFNMGDDFTIIHGIDAGNNNDKFIFTEDDARNLFWVGGNGYWNETAHWSLTDGGPGGECPPTLRDNIKFTLNSGFNADPDLDPDTVYTENKHVWFNDMEWEDGFPVPPVLLGYGDTYMHCWGNFKFSPDMENLFFGQHYFESQDELNWKTLDFTHMNGPSLNYRTLFSGLGGKWRLESDFYNLADTVKLVAGHLEMTDKLMGARWFTATDTLVKGLYLLGSTRVEIHAAGDYGWVFWSYDVMSEEPNTFFEMGPKNSIIVMLGDIPPPQPGAPYGPCHFRSWGDSIIYNNIQFHTPEQLTFPGAVNSIMQSDAKNGFDRVDYYCLKGQTVGAGYIDTLRYRYLGGGIGADSCMLTSNMYDINVALAEASGITVSGNHSIDTLIFNQDGLLEGGNQIRKYMEGQEYCRIKLLNTIEECVLLDNGEISGKNTFFRLKLSPDKRYLFGHQVGEMDTTVIVNDWDVNGYCDQPIRLQSDSIGTNAQIMYFALDPTYPDFTVNNASLRDIMMLDANGGGSYYANNSVDLGNNSTNWEFIGNSGNTYYWIGSTGYWGDFSNWSYTSGGPPLSEECTPKENNTVVFDDNSFSSANDTVTIAVSNAYCYNMYWVHNPANFTPTFMGSDTTLLFVYGSIELNESMDYKYYGIIHFDQILGDPEENYLFSKGNELQNGIVLEGIGDNVRLEDDLFITDTLTGYVILEHGNFDLNQKVMDVPGFNSIYKNPRGLDISGAEVHVRDNENRSWWLDASNLSFMGDDSEIHIDGESGTMLTQKTGTAGLTYHDVYMNKPTDSIANIFGKVSYNRVVGNRNSGVLTSETEDASGTFAADSVEMKGNGCWIAGNSETNVIIFTGNSGVIYKNHTVNDCYFYAPGQITATPTTTNTFQKCEFYSSGTFLGKNEFNYLYLYAGIAEEGTNGVGNTYDFQAGIEQIIYDSLFLRGNQCARISINAIQGSGEAFIRKDFGNDIQCDFLIINRVGFVGQEAECYAGQFTIEPVPPPTGWIFGNLSEYVYGFQGEEAYFCEGDYITLNAGSFNGDPFTEYYWNYSQYPEGPTYITNTTDPVHILVKYFEGCYVEDVIYPSFDEAPQVTIEEGPFCEGDPIHVTINPSDNDYSYEWFNQDDTPIIISKVGYTGDIWVKVKDLSGPAGCVGTGTENILVKPYPDPEAELGDDIWLKYGESTLLDAGEGTIYAWTADDASVIINPDDQQVIEAPWTEEPVEYTVDVDLEGCEKSGSIIVNGWPYSSMGVPTAFAPQGENKVLYVKGSGFAELDFRVYNRYGDLMFETNDIDVGWDGTYNGKPQEMDVYTYYIKVVYQDHGVAEETGNITLIR
ncbi:MAG: gliding motility-associated C-terminal domain-containing protein [Bacteroidales bacterium]|nr:gliding motility-associated C-terminal domain-containing protein [Bacteroidales bacterium]MCF8402904.1 gliding motility-associated C-terminal domain-containing protein [Bacteroidales bacterium]